MTPNEKNVMKGLVAVAWADGKLEDGEFGVIEGLLCGFDASDEEEQEILEFAKTRRSVADDIPVGDLSHEDRELLLSNAALLTMADGDVSQSERRVLDELIALLGFTRAEASEILTASASGAAGAASS